MNPPLSEQLVNGSLADALQAMSPRSQVYAETPCFVGNQRCPDVVRANERVMKEWGYWDGTGPGHPT